MPWFHLQCFLVTSFFLFISSLVYALCGPSKPKEVPEVDMSGMGSGNNTLAPPGGSPGAPPTQRGNIPSYQIFKGSQDDGVINNAEAPETFKVGEKFDMKSLNFANISDFRGDNVIQSAKIQNDRAASKGGASGMLTSFNDGGIDSDSYESYDSEEDNEMLAPTPSILNSPAPPVGGMAMPPAPPAGKRAAYEADMDAGIQTFTGAAPTAPPVPTRGGGVNVIQSLAIARDITSSEVGASKSKRVRKKKRRKKKVRKDLPEVTRKKVKVRKKRSRNHDNEESGA